MSAIQVRLICHQNYERDLTLARLSFSFKNQRGSNPTALMLAAHTQIDNARYAENLIPDANSSIVQSKLSHHTAVFDS